MVAEANRPIPFTYESLVGYFMHELKVSPESPIARARGDKATTYRGTLREQFPPYVGKKIAQELLSGEIGSWTLMYALMPEEVFPQDKPVGGYTVEPDGLDEGHREVIPGVVHAYSDRILITATNKCQAYCRYCTRSRIVGPGANYVPPEGSELNVLQNENYLRKIQIDNIFEYIRRDKKVRDAILSGGDPFGTLPIQILEYWVKGLSKLQRDGDLDSVRFGSRAIVQNPADIPQDRIDLLKEFDHVALMGHIITEKELTPEFQTFLQKLNPPSTSTLERVQNSVLSIIAHHWSEISARAVDKSPEEVEEILQEIIGNGMHAELAKTPGHKITVYSQSVFIDGVCTVRYPGKTFLDREYVYEDVVGPDGQIYPHVPIADLTIDNTATALKSRDFLYKLWRMGIIPYYWFNNDPTDTAAGFSVPERQFAEIAEEVDLIDIGLPKTVKFVVDTGYGKYPMSRHVINNKGFYNRRGQWHPV